jgi:hypothetical protein
MTMNKSTTGKQLISAAWAVLKQDKELMVLPVLGGVFASACIGLIAGVGYVAGAFNSAVATDPTSTTVSPLGYAFGALIAYITTTIALFFQAALIFGAMERLDGGDPTVASSIAAARQKLGAIMIWALIATTIGLILRAISERGGVLARIGSAVAGVAWTVATFFVLPVVIFEGINSFAAVKRSGQIISQRWGTVLRTNLRFSLQLFLAAAAAMGAIFGGSVLAIANIDSGRGLLILVGLFIALLGVFGLIAVIVVANALSGYVRAVLYRHAVGQPVPGISEEILAGAFQIKE